MGFSVTATAGSVSVILSFTVEQTCSFTPTSSGCLGAVMSEFIWLTVQVSVCTARLSSPSM